MALWSPPSSLPLLGLLSIIIFLRPTSVVTSPSGIRHGIIRKPSSYEPAVVLFREAPAFRNGDACGSSDADRIHVVMTLDANYLRGTIAALLSILQHSTCPENIDFHFLWSHFESDIFSSINSTFPFLNFKVYRFDSNRVQGGYTKKVEEWMAVQKKKRIYQLGSLPPFLLVLAGNMQPVHHRWNQHGLGGDNLEGRCRSLHPGPISLLHWSGKGKPWLRLDSRRPCTVDHLKKVTLIYMWDNKNIQKKKNVA
ncbi:unnamed protein product, partial [Vitis vinifera]